MIKSIKISGYRGFSSFQMSGLQRITLLVGTNNSGKTSALESLFLLASQGDPLSLWKVLSRRSERLTERQTTPYPDLDVSHLFTGHELRVSSHFDFEAENDSPGRAVHFTIVEISDEANPRVPTRQGVPIPSRIGLQIKAKSGSAITLPLSRLGGLSADSLDQRRVRRKVVEEEIPSQFITAETFGGNELLSLWDTISLTANEDRVLQALRILEPTIERIAASAVPMPEYYGSVNINQRGGFRVKFKDIEKPVPIGSMGDGIWRLLVMAIVIAQCKDGVLLIDEIDTGLHYSVMTEMWRLIFGAASLLQVQVFATTHSYDCVKSLAELCISNEEASKAVTLQRIERGQASSVPYTAKEIEIAARHRFEVR
jgi:AAA domain, putative AbiEii toxin, Type IV TA system